MPTKQRTAEFLTEPWSPHPPALAPAREVRVEVTRKHVDQAYWLRFQDPISIALRECLNEDTCADVFWNSDSFAPLYHDDEAMIGIYVEIAPENNDQPSEQHAFHLPLPVRAARAMWRLRNRGAEEFRDFTVRLTLPECALPHAV